MTLVVLKSEQASSQSGTPGLSAYQLWLMQAGNAGKTLVEFFESLKGDKGDDGASAFKVWLTLPGNAGKTEAEFVASLIGDRGLSAFEIWKIDTENTSASVDDFFESLKGDKGDSGISAFESWKLETGNNTATFADFMAAIKGEKGEKGDKGDKGDVGDKGDTGDKGETGASGSDAFQLWQATPGNETKTLAEYWVYLATLGGFEYNLIFDNLTSMVLSQPRAFNINKITYPAAISLVEYSTDGTNYTTAANGANSLTVAANTLLYIRITFATTAAQAVVYISGTY